MPIFDKKEEVLDVQLTPFGKYLLSRGQWNPAYYVFFDDGIVYDQGYAGFSIEEQNDIQTRIEDETPNLKLQTSFSRQDDGSPSIQKTQERNYFGGSPLGNSDFEHSYAAAWKVRFLKGYIEDSVYYLDDLYPTQKIPQFDMEDVKYKSYRTDEQTDLTQIPGRLILEDGTLVVTEDDYLLIEIDEANIEDEKENFEIEFFLVEETEYPISITATGGGEGEGYAEESVFETRETLQPLVYKQPKTFIVDGILLDEPLPRKEIQLDAQFVDYFLDVKIDREIPEEDFCRTTEEIRMGERFEKRRSVRCNNQSEAEEKVYEQIISEGPIGDEC